MATTGQNWIDTTRRHLMNGFNEPVAKLNANYTAGGTTLTVATAIPALQAGTRLSIGQNVFYVWSVSGTSITVSGGWDGSTDINHSSGAIVRINPRFTDWDIWNALSHDLSDLSANGIFAVNTTDSTFSTTTTGYDLGATAASNLISVLEVKYLTPGPWKDMPKLKSYDWRLVRNAYTGDLPSGIGIQLLRPQGITQGFKVRTVWKSTLTMPADVSYDVSSSGLLPSAYDLPPLGAAIQLMAGREVKRNFTESQGETRRSTEVPAGAIAASSNGLKQLRMMRIASEVARLRQMYPVVKD